MTGDLDLEGDAAAVVYHVAVALVLPPLDVLKARSDRRLIEERGAAWFEAHRTMLDNQWTALVELGLF